jgi:hypothetical protein
LLHVKRGIFIAFSGVSMMAAAGRTRGLPLEAPENEYDT